MAALLDLLLNSLGVGTIERTGAAGVGAIVLGWLHGGGSRQRVGHQPTSRQQNQAESHPEIEGLAQRVILRALSSPSG